MVSQLLDEAAQTVRPKAVTQPIPDSAYTNYNLPAARHMPLTTASKIVRATRVEEEEESNQGNIQIEERDKWREVKTMWCLTFVHEKIDLCSSYKCFCVADSFVQQQWLPFVKHLSLPFVQ